MSGLTRRNFLKTLCSFAGAGLAGLLFPRRLSAQVNSTRVACVTDGQAWTGKAWGNDDLDLGVLRSMIERALKDLTGHSDASAALSSLIPSLSDPSQRIGIKANCVNSKLPTHPRVVTALTELLISAGANPDNIIIYDRTDSELAACGFSLNTDTGCKVFGNDHPGIGYSDDFVTLTDGTIRLSKILTEKVDHLINVPILKNHEMADVTLSLKNHFGSIDAPDRLHGGDRDCCPGIAEVNALPSIRNLTRLVLIDATFGTFSSGLGSRPDFAPMSVIAATDPVAADTVGQQIINARRSKEGLAALDAKHIHQAAERDLGTDDPNSIERIDTVFNEVTEKPKPWKSGGSSGCASMRNSGTGLALGLAGAAAIALRKRK
jgi:uncharacterized protein (DUF362 family)